MMTLAQWRGLTTLIVEAVEHGASAIERVHLDTLRRPFAALKYVPGLAVPAQAVHTLIATQVSATYGMVRAVTRSVGDAAHLSLNLINKNA